MLLCVVTTYLLYVTMLMIDGHIIIESLHRYFLLVKLKFYVSLEMIHWYGWCGGVAFVLIAAKVIHVHPHRLWL